MPQLQFTVCITLLRICCGLVIVSLRMESLCLIGSGVVVSALASINEVNQRRARLVLRWVTVSGFNSR